MATSLSPLKFEPKAIYLILLDRGDTYLSTSPHDGNTFHINNEAGPTPALFALDDEGYVTLKKSVKYLVMLNKSKTGG